MTLNVTLPVSPAIPAASPAAASTGNAATTGATKTDPSAASSNPGSPAASSSAPVAPSASAASDAAANAAADADLFAKMLGAQMDSLTALPQATAAPAVADASTDKPAKATLPQIGATTDPALLLNSALAALQMPIVQPKQPPQSAAPANAAAMDSTTQTPGSNANPLPSGANAALAANGTQVLGSGTDAKFAAETEKLAFAELARAAIGRQDAESLQKLPQEGAGQPTILPQSSEPKIGVTPEKSATAVPSFDVEQHLGTPAWSKAIGEHVMTMVTMKAEGARIQISPPQLGPIEVTLKMDAHNNAQLTFTADSAATRAALENSLPKLHTMMAASGIQLGDAQVSSGQSQRQQQQSAQQNRFNAQPEAVEGEEMDTLASIKAARGVLSIFA